MSVTLDLHPAIEQKLRERAILEGRTLEEYLRRLAEQALTMNGAASAPKPASAAIQDKNQRLAAWKAFTSELQSLACNADDCRESIYEGRGE